MLRVLLVIAMSACYAPGIEPSCTIACVANECPAGYVCTDGKHCAMPGDTCGSEPPNDGSQCYGTGTAPFLRVCPSFSFPPTMSLNEVIDTDACAHVMSQQLPDAPDVCVLAAEDITFVGGVKVRGSRSLLVLGTRSVVVEPGAILDVASHVGSTGTIPGSPGPGCNAGNGAELDTSMSGGGGGGGGFGGPGREGGSGGLGQSLAGSGGVPRVPTFVRGGCPGGTGGYIGGGVGGGGGGAIYLLSNGPIRIEGTINASGGGGGAPAIRGGGGGGGSGGMILLEGSEVMFAPNGGAFALGGGGASGGSAIVAGNLGSDPIGIGMYAPDSLPAGTPAGTGGGGGRPIVGNPGTDGGAGSGGGGGGGAGGVIRIRPAGRFSRTDPPAQ